MMQTDGWTVYYSILAGAAAALAGLVFVALSRSAESWRTDTVLNIVGASTVAEFVAPVFVSLAQLMPVAGARYVAVGVGVGGEILAVAFLYLSTRPLQKQHEGRYGNFLKWQRRFVWLSFAAYGALIAGGLFAPHVGSQIVAWACLWLLFSGSVEAWLFLDIGLNAGRHEQVDRRRGAGSPR